MTVKVIAESAHSAVISLMRMREAVPFSKAMPEITKGLQDNRNAALRRNCALYLYILLNERGMEEVKKELDTIVQLTVAISRDNSATTRTRARAIYAVLRKLSPRHANRILEQVDRKLKQILEEEGGDVEISETLSSPPSSARSSRNPSRNPSRNTSRNPSRAQSRSSSPTRAQATNSPSYLAATQASAQRAAATTPSRISHISSSRHLSRSQDTLGNPTVDMTSLLSKLHALEAKSNSDNSDNSYEPNEGK